jgi:hypothetical protein
MLAIANRIGAAAKGCFRAHVPNKPPFAGLEATGHTSAPDPLAASPGSGGRRSPEGAERSGAAAQRLDGRPQRPTITRGSGRAYSVHDLRTIGSRRRLPRVRIISHQSARVTEQLVSLGQELTIRLQILPPRNRQPRTLETLQTMKQHRSILLTQDVFTHIDP